MKRLLMLLSCCVFLGHFTQSNASSFDSTDCTSGYLKHNGTVMVAAIDIKPITGNCYTHPTYNTSCQGSFSGDVGDTCPNCCCFEMDIVNHNSKGTIIAFRMMANDDSTDICHFCAVWGSVLGTGNPTYSWIPEAIHYLAYSCCPLNCVDSSVGALPTLDTISCGIHFLARTFTGPTQANCSRIYWWGGGDGDTIHVRFCLGNRKNPYGANTCHHLKIAFVYDTSAHNCDSTNHYVTDTVSFPICCDSTYHYCIQPGMGTISKEYKGVNVISPENETLIYPNPTTGTATVEFAAPGQGTATMTLVNMTGLQVHQDVIQCNAPGKYKFTVDTRNLGTGTYICTIRQGDNYYSKSLIVVK